MLIRCSDVDVLDAIAKHPSVYDSISDDNSPAVEDFSLCASINNPSVIFLLFLASGTPAGFWMFLPSSPDATLYDVHTCILPEFRGKTALIAASEAMKWMFTKSTAKVLTTRCPMNNPAAARFARMVGMRYIYTIPNSFPKDGKTYDSEYYAIDTTEVEV